MPIDLFRVSMSPQAGPAVAKLYTPDEQGRIYCGQGQYTDLFEQSFARATGLSRNPLGVNSCSAALDLSLVLIGVGPGDEVISSPLNCTAGSGAIANRGARIVWADIDPLTGIIDPASVARLVSPKTKAVMIVDWAGRSGNYQALRGATNQQDRVIPLIEDAAHRLYLAPQYGDYVAWSFGPIKALTTGGYGGALLPPHEQYEKARLLRWHGLDRRSSEDFRCAQNIEMSGFRYHMTDDQAVVGLANLALAQRAVSRARLNAQWYCQVFKNVPGIQVPDFDPACDYWLFTILVDDRDGLKAYLTERGIGASQVHARNDRHTAFRRAAVRQDGELRGVNYFDSHQLAIPVGWWLTNDQREEVASAVIEFAGKTVRSYAGVAE